MFGYFEQKATDLWKIVAPESTPLDQYFEAASSGDVSQLGNFPTFNPNSMNQNGQTAIQIACLGGNLHMVRHMMDMGGDITSRSTNGETCLHFASRSGNIDLVKFLIEECNLKVTDKSNNGSNAYDVAKGYGLKQYLMQLVFREESENGQQVEILGATRDSRADEERLRNIGPPPTGGAPQNVYNYSIKAQSRKPGSRRAIKENDGFGTTVGNPELSAKYGNQTTFTPFELDTGSVTSGSVDSRPPSSGLNPTVDAPKPPQNPARSFKPRPKYIPFQSVAKNKPAQPLKAPFTPGAASSGPINPSNTPVVPEQKASVGMASKLKAGPRIPKVKIFNPALRKA